MFQLREQPLENILLSSLNLVTLNFECRGQPPIFRGPLLGIKLNIGNTLNASQVGLFPGSGEGIQNGLTGALVSTQFFPG